jgi:hypothetical protein
VEPTLEIAPGDAAAQADSGNSAGGNVSGRKLLGEMLVEAGLIDPRQVRQALDEGAKSGKRLGEIVVKHGWATEEQVGKMLAEQWGIDYVDRASIFFDAAALNRISKEDAQRLEALPTRIEGGRVVVAVAEPTEEQIHELRGVIGEDPVLIVVPRTALEAGLHSDLLTSRGDGTGGVPRSRPPEPPSITRRVERAIDEPGPQEAAAREEAQKNTPLPDPLPVDIVEEVMNGTVTSEVEGLDSVAALAAQARGVADLIAAQAEAMRNETAKYGKRIEQLEAELASRNQAMAELRKHLEAAVRLLPD